MEFVFIIFPSAQTQFQQLPMAKLVAYIQSLHNLIEFEFPLKTGTLKTPISSNTGATFHFLNLILLS
jgi:hypothetical protein